MGITISGEVMEEVAAFDDFERDYFADNEGRLDQLTSEEYWNLRELEESIAGFWNEDDIWRRASERAYERLADEALELWEAVASRPFRRHIRRLRQKVAEEEQQAKSIYHDLCTAQARLVDEGRPPVCKCGAVSYTVECSRCRRILRWDGWQHV